MHQASLTQTPLKSIERVLIAAGASGLLGVLLLRHAPWGVNVPLWLLASAAVSWMVAFPRRPVMRKVVWLSAIPVVGFAAAFAWHDSDELKIANGLMLFFSLGAMALASNETAATAGGNYLLRLVGVWFRFISDFSRLLLHGIEEHRSSRQYRRLGGVLRGAIIALPLLILFGALFASADAVFFDWLKRCTDFDPTSLFTSLMTFAIVTPLVGGLTAQVLLPEIPPVEAEAGTVVTVSVSPREAISTVLGPLEIVTAISLLDALFVAFVAVQLRYFFGGAGHVLGVAGLTYADYARKGFFELTAAAVLVLPLILGAKTFIQPTNVVAKRAFPIASAVLLGCVGVILLSAMQRMRLYVEVFGLTELRLYTGFFMIWLAAALSWATWVVFSRWPRTFLQGSLIIGYCVVAAANFVNPDSLIASTNLAVGKADLGYLAALSVDAAPAIEKNLDRLPVRDRDTLRQELMKSWRPSQDALDWRSANYSRVEFDSKLRPALFGRQD